MAVLPLKDVVNVIVNLSPRSAVRSGFNLSMLWVTARYSRPQIASPSIRALTQ
jgi:hypothetical protein